MKYDRLYNFISPVTGKLPIDKNYILIGDKEGKSVISPVLIDVRQDIIDLKRKIGNFEELKKLDHNRIWIGDYYNEPQETLHIGVINLPPLAEAVFPNPITPVSGDFRIPNPTFDYTSAFDWVMSGPFLPQIYATQYDTFGNPTGTDVSSSLAMTQVRAAQIMKRFDNANFIVGSSIVNFDWENPKMYLIPDTLKQLYGLGTTYTFTKAQSLGALETGLLKNTVNDNVGKLSKAIPGIDYVEITNNPIGPLIVYNGQKFISPTTSTIRKNKPDEFGKIIDTVNVIETDYITAKNLAVSDLIPNSMLKVNDKGELTKAIGDSDYSLVSTVTNIKNIVDVLNTYLLKVTSLDKVPSGKTPPTVTPEKVTDVIPTVQDVSDSEKNPYVSPKSSIVSGVFGAIGTAASVAMTLTTFAMRFISFVPLINTTNNNEPVYDFDYIINRIKAIPTLDYSYADKTGTSSVTASNTPIMPTISGTSDNYLDRTFIQYRPVLSENKFYDTDNLTDWGKGNIWYDNDNYDQKGSLKNRAGLRITAWDSSLSVLTENSRVPHSIGIFGYNWNYINNPRTQKGFVWEAEFENNYLEERYRFPKKFSLRSVGHDQVTPDIDGEVGRGWNLYDDELMNYDLYQNKFNFQRDVNFLTKGAIKIPVGNIAQRPSKSEIGMLRYNTEI